MYGVGNHAELFENIARFTGFMLKTDFLMNPRRNYYEEEQEK